MGVAGVDAVPSGRKTAKEENRSGLQERLLGCVVRRREEEGVFKAAEGLMPQVRLNRVSQRWTNLSDTRCSWSWKL